MADIAQIGIDFRDRLALQYCPIGFYYAPQKPEGSVGFKKPGGCIAGMIFTAAKGKTVAMDKATLGWPCSQFYLGFKDWIFEGIEHFLTCGPFPGREPERFSDDPAAVKRYVASLRYPELVEGAAIFKPLEHFTDSEIPELVTFFANADQLSALTQLAHYRCPEAEDRVVARFAAACSAVVAVPMDFKRRGLKRAVWGGHDITARVRWPKDLMTFTIPWDMAVEMWEDMPKSFLITEAWAKLAARITESN